MNTIPALVLTGGRPTPPLPRALCGRPCPPFPAGSPPRGGLPGKGVARTAMSHHLRRGACGRPQTVPEKTHQIRTTNEIRGTPENQDLTCNYNSICFLPGTQNDVRVDTHLVVVGFRQKQGTAQRLKKADLMQNQ